MATEVSTLAMFFGADSATSKSRVKALEKSSGWARSLAEPLRGPAAQKALEAADEVLSSPFAEIFGKAWKKRRDLLRFRDPALYPPERTHEYVLTEHEIALKRKPVVEVMLNGAPAGVRLELELKLALAMKGAVLKIKNARIIGARVGDFRGEGRFYCGQVTLAERKSGAFKLPGEIAFGEGIPLG